MSLPPRTDIDSEYRFDLTHIYETPADWDTARESLLNDLDGLEARADAPLESTDDLRALLEATEECYRRKQRLELYTKLARNVHTNDDAADDRMQRHRELLSMFEPVIARVRRRLRTTDDDRLDDLGDYRRYAETLREQATHTCSADVENAIAAFEGPRTAPTRVILAVTTEDFDPQTVERPDGESVAIRYGNRKTELSHGNREYRRRVYEAYRGEMDRFEHTLTRAYAAKLQASAAETEVREYDSIRNRALHHRCYPESGLQSALPGEVHDAMLDGIRDTLGPYHRAHEVRRARLGVETLRPWDLDVSIADADVPELDYEDARDHILAALEPLGMDYTERVGAFFEERRIDAFPTADKRTDIPAYCPSSVTDGAYILANFRGDVRTAFFLCHELGHAMHAEHHRAGPVRYATCPRPVEEVPSILHELLLAEHFIEESGALAAAGRNRLLECIGGNLYGAAMSSAFVHRLVTMVEEGRDVTARRARETWADLQSEFRPPVAYDERAGRNWLGRGGRELYSKYQYVLGATDALTVREQLRAGELATDEYRDFLRNTGRDDAVALFERLGCDVTAATPYERAAATFDGYIDVVRQSE